MDRKLSDIQQVFENVCVRGQEGPVDSQAESLCAQAEVPLAVTPHLLCRWGHCCFWLQKYTQCGMQSYK